MITPEKIVKRSAAEFFEANKAIAGFDNPTRSTYTSIRELVENALDAAEKGGFLPEIIVNIEIMSEEELAGLLGLDDFALAEDANYEFLKLSVRDNGIGIRHEAIPQLFGRVLTGSNFGERQSRGRFGLGAKMVLIYSQSTIHVPFEIKSRRALSKKKSAEFTSHYQLFIDIVKNAPEIILAKKLKTKGQLKNHGTEVSVCFAGTWSRAKRYIYEYFSQMAVITPYATFRLTTPDNPKEPIVYKRTVRTIPPLATEVPLHPVGTDINQLKSEISRTRSRTMKEFLKTHFQRIGDKTAREVLKISRISLSKDPKKLDEMEMRRLIHEGFTKVRFLTPDGRCLSPLGHENLASGLVQVFNSEFVCSETRPPSSYSGHAFLVEVAIGYGGENSPPYKLLRFANRIPLLFGEGNDLIKKTIEDINWSNYKSNLNNDPLIFAVSLVSTKIPFPETSKEYIAEVDEIRKELRLCLQSAGRKLLRFQRALKKRMQAAKRLKVFQRYAPVVSSIVGQMLGKMEEEEFDFLFSPTQFTRCLELREGSAFLPKNPIPVEALPTDSITSVDLERYDIQTLQDLIMLDDLQLQELFALGLSEEAIDQAEQILSAILELPELAKEELVESASAKALDEFIKERGIISGMELFQADDPVTSFSGVGPATQKELKRMGIKNVKQFFLTENEELTKTNLALGVIIENKRKCSLDVLPNLTKQTFNELHKNKLYTVLDFLEAEEALLTKISELSAETISSLKKLIRKHLDLSLDELKEAPVEEEEEEIEEGEEEIVVTRKRAKEEQKKRKKEKRSLPPVPMLEVDASVEVLESIGKTMVERLQAIGIDTVAKFYMAKNSRLLKIKGLGVKTIAKNRGLTDVIVLPRINFEGKNELNKMGIYTVRQFLEAEDDSLTIIRGLRLPTITKLKLDIENKLLMTPGSKAVPKRKKPLPKKSSKPRSAPKVEPKSKAKKPSQKRVVPPAKKKKPVEKADKSIAEFLGTKKQKTEEELAATEALRERIKGPPPGLLDPSLRIRDLKGMGKKTEEQLRKVGVKKVGDIFKKDIARLATVRGIKEEDIIEMRKKLSVEVLPRVNPQIKEQLNAMGIYTVKQFIKARIAKTSSVKGLGPKTVRIIRAHINQALKTSAELEGKVAPSKPSGQEKSKEKAKKPPSKSKSKTSSVSKAGALKSKTSTTKTSTTSKSRKKSTTPKKGSSKKKSLKK